MTCNRAATSQRWSVRLNYHSQQCRSTCGCCVTQEWSWQEWTGHGGFTGFRHTRWAMSRPGSSRTDRCGSNSLDALERHLDTLADQGKIKEDES